MLDNMTHLAKHLHENQKDKAYLLKDGKPYLALSSQTRAWELAQKLLFCLVARSSWTVNTRRENRARLYPTGGGVL